MRLVLDTATMVAAIRSDSGASHRLLQAALQGAGVTLVVSVPLLIEYEAVMTRAEHLQASGLTAIFGDAGAREILKTAGIEQATYLLVTLPDLTGRIPVVAAARILNPSVKIFTRARYLAERAMLEEAGSTGVSYEEAEVAVSLATFLLKEIGAEEDAIGHEAERIRQEIAVRTGFTMIMPAPRRKPRTP